MVQRHSCVVFVDSIIVAEERGGVMKSLLAITGGIRVKRNLLILLSSNRHRKKNRNVKATTTLNHNIRSLKAHRD